MKILMLRFQNLNSLQGKWQIDFRHPAYANEGIFTITGATGAGKSTILDAICLALYGATPRLGDITQGKNDIMSRGTGECFAEVVFATHIGNFRSFWGQKRARQKPDGKLQAPKHEIAHFVSDTVKGNIIEEKASKTKGEIERITGMDFQRFTRAMLLAQGSFSAFLQASSDERSPILEQITGTAIYSDISKKVHEIFAQSKTKLAELQANLAGAEPLSDEQQQYYTNKLAITQQEIKQLNQKISSLQAQKDWQAKISKIQEQREIYQQKQRDIHAQLQDFLPQQQRLTQGKHAYQLTADYREYEHIRQQLSANIDKQQYWQQQSPSLEQRLTQQQQAEQQYRTKHQHAEQQWQDRQSLFQKVREHDYQLHNLAQQQQALHQQQQALTAKLQHNHHAYQQQQHALHTCQQQYQQLTEQHQQLAVFAEHANPLPRLQDLAEQTRQQHQQVQGISRQIAQAKHQTQTIGNRLAELEQQQQQHATEQQLAQVNRQNFEQTINAFVQSFCNHLEPNTPTSDALITSVPSDFIQPLHQVLNQLQHAQFLLQTLQEQHQRWQTSVADAHQLQQEKTQLTQAISQTQRECQQLLQSEQQQQQTVDLLWQNQQLRHKIINLQHERHALINGEPCPLCGATSHPYAKQQPNAERALSETEQQLKIAKEKLATTQANRQNSEKKLAQLNQAEQHLNQNQQKIEQHLTELASMLINQMRDFYQNYPHLLTFEHIQDWQNANLATLSTDLSTDLTDFAEQIHQNIDQKQQIIAQLAEYQRQLDTFNSQKQTLTEKSHKLQHDRHLTEQAQRQAMANEQQLTAQLEQANSQLLEIHTKIEQILQPFGHLLSNTVKQVKNSTLAPTLTQLEQKFQQCQTEQQQLQQLNEHKQQSEKTLLTLQSETEHLTSQNQQLNQQLSQINQQSEQLKQSRFALFGDKDVNQAEKALLTQKSQAFEAWQHASQATQQLSQDWHVLTENLRQITALIGKQQQTFNQTQQHFLQKLDDVGFDSIDAYLQACLTDVEREKLQKTADALQQQQQLTEHKLQEIHDEYQQLTAQNLTNLTLEILEDKLKQKQSLFNEKQQLLGSLSLNLANNERIKQRQAEAVKALQTHQQQHEQWQHLHSLIGSSDGKKFRNFAQGLTFSLMINHANEQLGKMSERYLLVADSEQPLNLNVIDNYQGGEVRTSKNLSGGESFIISLALALGLSNMASHRMQVDSLFLDEGFGTLDDEALDTALDTLSTLQQSGKLIGVISHIQALKERISSKITVMPTTGGVSKIVGQGVKKLA